MPRNTYLCENSFVARRYRTAEYHREQIRKTSLFGKLCESSGANLTFASARQSARSTTWRAEERTQVLDFGHQMDRSPKRMLSGLKTYL